MDKIINYIMAISIFITLILQTSCKAKYLEVKAQYDKAMDKKPILLKENRQMKKDLVLIRDTVRSTVEYYNKMKVYGTEFTSIENMKKEFLDNKVNYYLEIKKRQAKPVKKKNK